MKAVKFINGLGHEQILNLENITSFEKPSSATGIILQFGKDHIQITLKTKADRDHLFQRIGEILEAAE